MAKRKTLGQICFEAMYGPNSGKTWRTYQDCSKEPYERAAAAVEREVLRRLKQDGVFRWTAKGVSKVKRGADRLLKQLNQKPKTKKH